MTVPMENGVVRWVPRLTKPEKLAWIEKEYANRVEDIARLLRYTHALEEALKVEKKYELGRPIFTERASLMSSDLFRTLDAAERARQIDARRRLHAEERAAIEQARREREAKKQAKIEKKLDQEEKELEQQQGRPPG